MLCDFFPLAIKTIVHELMNLVRHSKDVAIHSLQLEGIKNDR